MAAARQRMATHGAVSRSATQIASDSPNLRLEAIWMTIRLTYRNVRTSARSTARTAADIPRFSMSSSSGGVVVPSKGFVVGLAGLEDAVEDAYPAVGELAQCGLVADLPGSVPCSRPWRRRSRALNRTPIEPPRHVRRLQSLGRLESCLGTRRRGTRLS